MASASDPAVSRRARSSSSGETARYRAAMAASSITVAVLEQVDGHALLAEAADETTGVDLPRQDERWSVHNYPRALGAAAGFAPVSR
jgi:hypothetical protein